ncbi:MAG: right-handed parallel beta-helix repeat-containing protein [Ignavibacteria bacterium]|nr:right-handed parallel beta-helix repeat-containing protein [Ignavibacteria bacterium]
MDSRNQFIGNTFDGGAYGFYWWGSTYTPVTSCDQYTVWDGNTFTNQYVYGLYLYYQDTPIFKNNTITMNNTYTNYGLMTYYMMGPLEFTGNKVPDGRRAPYGVLIYSYGCTNSLSSHR